MAKLPGPAQAAVKGAFFLWRSATSVLFASHHLGQNLAERISKERGDSPERTKKLRGMLATADIALAKPTAMGVGGIAGPLAGFGASFIPIATSSYLLYSAARNPMAAAKVAGDVIHEVTGGIGGAAKSVSEHIFGKERHGPNQPKPQWAPTTARPAYGEGGRSEGGYFRPGIEQVGNVVHNALSREDADKIADALEIHDYDDWYIALLSQAIDRLKNLDKAIAAANEGYRRYPKNPAINASLSDKDTKAVLGSLVTNAAAPQPPPKPACPT